MQWFVAFLTEFAKLEFRIRFLIERFCRHILHMNTNTFCSPNLKLGLGGIHPNTTWLEIKTETTLSISTQCQVIG